MINRLFYSNPLLVHKLSCLVPPPGIGPGSRTPQARILSIKLRGLVTAMYHICQVQALIFGPKFRRIRESCARSVLSWELR